MSVSRAGRSGFEAWSLRRSSSTAGASRCVLSEPRGPNVLGLAARPRHLGFLPQAAHRNDSAASETPQGRLEIEHRAGVTRPSESRRPSPLLEGVATTELPLPATPGRTRTTIARSDSQSNSGLGSLGSSWLAFESTKLFGGRSSEVVHLGVTLTREHAARSGSPGSPTSRSAPSGVRPPRASGMS